MRKSSKYEICEFEKTNSCYNCPLQNSHRCPFETEWGDGRMLGLAILAVSPFVLAIIAVVYFFG